jgi:peptide/nickel transport system permease protein/oligopeptide transport system permease protein
LIQGAVLLMAVSYVLVNLLVDVAYAWLDPRIHYA